MYIIINKLYEKVNNKKCYLGKSLNDNFSEITTIENALMFETKEKANDYLKKHKNKYYEIIEYQKYRKW